MRDVVFQKNPFSGPALESLEVFEEAPRFCLESEVHNRRWIQEFYGESVLKMLGKHLVICSGVTVGKRSEILSYLDKMTDSLSRYYASTGFDQAVHNYLLRTLNVPDWLIRKFGDGRVIHVGTAAWNDLSLDASGNVVNDRGEPFSILHQYDRHPELVENVMRKLAA